MGISRRRVLGVLAGAAAAVGVPSVWIYRMKTYSGPVSDHFDGMRFLDPDGSPPKSLGEVLRWQFGPDRQRQAWPVWVPSEHADTPPPRVSGGKLRLSFVGHASWLIQTSGLNILIDPVWSARASPVSWAGPKRCNDPGVAFEALPPIDIVLVSHGHYDHLDVATLSKLAAKFSPRVITPLGNDVTMRSANEAIRAEAFDWHDRVELGNGIAVTLVPTRHWSARGLFDATRRCGRVLSWRLPRAKSTSSAIPAMATASISVASRRRMARCGWRSSRLAPMSRDGSCRIST